MSCEGWSGPGDQQIVPGSCMLEYRIDRINRIGLAKVLKVAAIICVILYIINKCKAKKRAIHQQPEEHERANPQLHVPQQIVF